MQWEALNEPPGVAVSRVTRHARVTSIVELSGRLLSRRGGGGGGGGGGLVQSANFWSRARQGTSPACCQHGASSRLPVIARSSRLASAQSCASQTATDARLGHRPFAADLVHLPDQPARQGAAVQVLRDRVREGAHQAYARSRGARAEQVRGADAGAAFAHVTRASRGCARATGARDRGRR